MIVRLAFTPVEPNSLSATAQFSSSRKDLPTKYFPICTLEWMATRLVTGANNLGLNELGGINSYRALGFEIKEIG